MVGAGGTLMGERLTFMGGDWSLFDWWGREGPPILSPCNGKACLLGGSQHPQISSCNYNHFLIGFSFIKLNLLTQNWHYQMCLDKPLDTALKKIFLTEKLNLTWNKQTNFALPLQIFEISQTSHLAKPPTPRHKRKSKIPHGPIKLPPLRPHGSHDMYDTFINRINSTYISWWLVESSTLSLEEAYCQVRTLEQAQKQLASDDSGILSAIAKQRDQPARITGITRITQTMYLIIKIKKQQNSVNPSLAIIDIKR